MKMKPFLIFLIFTVVSIWNCSAQSNSDNVSINIRFLPVQTITVNPSQKSVELVYATAEDYERGVSAEYNNHLAVFSNGGFQVNVAANNVDFIEQSGDRVLPVSDLIVKASNSSENSSVYDFSDVMLSTAQTTLISSNDGGRDLRYNITYDNSAAGSDGTYKSKYSTTGNSESIFSVEVTYTITSK